MLIHILKAAGILVLLTIWFGSGDAVAQPAAVKSEANTNEFFGVVSEKEYSNEFFGFSLPIPLGFTVIESQEAQLYSSAGVDMLKNTDAAKSKAMESSLAKQATLIGILEKPFGAPANSAIEIAVVKQPRGITANQALLSSVALMTSTGKLKVVRSIAKPTFGNHNFVGAVLSGEFNSVVVTQESYVIMRRGYSVHIAVTYSTDSGRKSIMPILEQIRFMK